MAVIKLSPLVDSLSGKAGGASFGSWKGQPYVRETPRRIAPNSASQTSWQLFYSRILRAWQYTPTPMLFGWDAFYPDENITRWNRFMKFNRQISSWPYKFLLVPASLGMVAPANWTAVPGSSTEEVDITWTNFVSPGAVWCNVVASSPFQRSWIRSSTFTVPSTDMAMTIGGLKKNQTWVINGWFTLSDYSSFSGSVLDDVVSPP